MEMHIPPASEQAEKVVLGSVIYNPKLYYEIYPFFNEKTIYNDYIKNVFNLIKDMIERKELIDTVSVCSNITNGMRKNGVNEYFITGLMDDLPTSEAAIQHAKTVYEKYVLREIINSARNIESNVHKNGRHAYDILSETYSEIGKLIHYKPNAGFDISKSLSDTMSSIQDTDKNLITTGFKKIDELSGGMTRGEITIIAGRPGHCKTTLMLNVMRKSIHKGLKVIMFNREMTNVEMLKKLIALESGEISYMMLRKGIFDLEVVAKIEKAKKLIETLYSSDKFLMFDNIRDFNGAAAEVERFKPDIVFDDYIQLIVPDNKIEQRRLQIEKIVHDYNWLAKTYNCVAVVLSQLNRMVETRGDSRPKLSDIAESGAIEQVAENVFFVYYDYKVNLNKSKLGANILEVIGSKVRYGNSGVIKLGYLGDKVRLYQNPEDVLKK